MPSDSESSKKLLTELYEFIEDTMMELHFRGCDKSHRLLQRAEELREKIEKARADFS